MVNKVSILSIKCYTESAHSEQPKEGTMWLFRNREELLHCLSKTIGDNDIQGYS